MAMPAAQTQRAPASPTVAASFSSLTLSSVRLRRFLGQRECPVRCEDAADAWRSGARRRAVRQPAKTVAAGLDRRDIEFDSLGGIGAEGCSGYLRGVRKRG